jgi:hypothetical protein
MRTAILWVVTPCSAANASPKRRIQKYISLQSRLYESIKSKDMAEQLLE